jgi:DNA-binding NarL/FixJ family response regulator
MTDIVIVDEHRGLHPDLRAILGVDPELSVVGEADSGDGAIAEVERARPDIAIVGVRSSDLSGMGIGIALLTRFPQLRVVVLASSPAEKAARLLSRISAHGVVLGESDPTVIRQGIHAVAGGESFVDPAFEVGVRSGR